MKIVNDILGLIIVIGSYALIIYCPIFKPWFGFHKPKGHKGKWGE